MKGGEDKRESDRDETFVAFCAVVFFLKMPCSAETGMNRLGGVCYDVEI